MGRVALSIQPAEALQNPPYEGDGAQRRRVLAQSIVEAQHPQSLGDIPLMAEGATGALASTVFRRLPHLYLARKLGQIGFHETGAPGCLCTARLCTHRIGESE